VDEFKTTFEVDLLEMRHPWIESREITELLTILQVQDSERAALMEGE
jgi:hypothetical protein